MQAPLTKVLGALTLSDYAEARDTWDLVCGLATEYPFRITLFYKLGVDEGKRTERAKRARVKEGDDPSRAGGR